MEDENMKHGDENEDSRLESVMDRFFSELPQREAPVSLIPRVQAVLAARARRPWWRSSYQDWETGTQIGVLLGSSISFLILWWGLAELVPVLETMAWNAWGGPLKGAIEPLLTLGTALGAFFQRLAGRVPLTFLYGAGVMVMLGYFFLVSTGALLCRIVQLQRTR